jgi:hypothetical protein
MAIENDLNVILSPLVSGRCYPLVAPDNAVKPYILFQVIKNSPEMSLDGTNTIDRCKVQIDIYGDSYASIKQLESQVRDTMASANFTNTPLFFKDLYDEDLNLYREQMKYSTWE